VPLHRCAQSSAAAAAEQQMAGKGHRATPDGTCTGGRQDVAFRAYQQDNTFGKSRSVRKQVPARRRCRHVPLRAQGQTQAAAAAEAGLQMGQAAAPD
jgi:hypothetical protein